MKSAAKARDRFTHLDVKAAVKKVPKELKRLFGGSRSPELMNANLLSISCTLTPFPGNISWGGSVFK